MFALAFSATASQGWQFFMDFIHKATLLTTCITCYMDACLCILEIVLCCVIVFVQVASSEWFLVVQIQDFENPYNFEIRKKKYCCCGDHDTTCVDPGTDIIAANSSLKCTKQTTCQPYYALRVDFQGCSDDETCPVSATTDVLVHVDSTFATSLFLPQLNVTLNQSVLQTYNQVRICH